MLCCSVASVSKENCFKNPATDFSKPPPMPVLIHEGSLIPLQYVKPDDSLVSLEDDGSTSLQQLPVDA